MVVRRLQELDAAETRHREIGDNCGERSVVLEGDESPVGVELTLDIEVVDQALLEEALDDLVLDNEEDSWPKPVVVRVGNQYRYRWPGWIGSR